MAENERLNDILSQKNEKELEKFVYIDIFSTPKIEGIGGLYKHTFKDFIVKEIVEGDYILDIKQDNTNHSFSEESKDRFTTFNLVKLNRDTFDVIRHISKALNIPIDSIYYSGLKDKCSISVQKVSIKGNHIEELRKLKLKDIFIRNISPSKKPVKIGSNWGNHFIITIRNIEKFKNAEKRIKKIFQVLQIKGFPNYYGQQRFGTFRPNSHLIGRFILENKFKEAFDEFVVNSYSTELIKSQIVRNELRKTGNLEKALNDFPTSLNYERHLIKYLIENPSNYRGAINELPNYLKKLLISAFQSYLFNRMLSLRIKKGFSLFRPIKGDVVCILEDLNGSCSQVIYQFGGNYDKYLKEALSLNHAAIVIPLIGYDTDLDKFPLMKTLLEEIFDQEQINQEIFNYKQLRDFEFKGSYRPMIIKPTGLNLIEFTGDDVFQDKFKLKLEFSLQKGSYATMLLRELMK